MTNISITCYQIDMNYCLIAYICLQCARYELFPDVICESVWCVRSELLPTGSALQGGQVQHGADQAGGEHQHLPHPGNILVLRIVIFQINSTWQKTSVTLHITFPRFCLRKFEVFGQFTLVQEKLLFEKKIPDSILQRPVCNADCSSAKPNFHKSCVVLQKYFKIAHCCQQETFQ